MNYDRIDVLEKGTVWQGGSVDDAIDQEPFVGPLMIICMDRGEANEQWINHETVEAVLAVWIDDWPGACLKDEVLKGLASSGAAWLAEGGNLYVHCAAGVSRASYYDIALHCTVLGISADNAFAQIKAQRSVADPNSGFLAQLQRLWPQPPTS